MSVIISSPVVYPDSDGEPRADNTLQYEWITTIKGGLDARFANDPDVFVAGDLLWYPVENNNRTRLAPDVMVVVGRPKGHRGSYKQWEEDNTAPQVVFEILSPGNRPSEMGRKFDFYQQFGVEEYYLYDPLTFDLSGWVCGRDGRLHVAEWESEWVSPRLGVRFVVPEAGELQLYHPDGRRFLSFAALSLRRDDAEQRADAERRRADRLAARLRALGIDPDADAE